jgi:hypothetical protein
VLYASVDEICDGSISMGIGGYLSARGDAASVRRTSEEDDDIEVENNCGSSPPTATLRRMRRKLMARRYSPG